MKCMSHAVLLAAPVVVLGLLTGCETTTTRAEATPPSISVATNHNLLVPGEATLVRAQTGNLAGAPALKWEVIGPDGNPQAGGKISPELKYGNQTAIFTAERPGTYMVRATVTDGVGRTVASQTQIKVVGSGLANE